MKSPDGEVDAVLMKSDGGATTSFSYNLFLLPKGTSSKKLSLDDSRLIADRAESLKITWIESPKSVMDFSNSANWLTIYEAKQSTFTAG
ncbi:hypothetical protein, partial [Pseudanabaena sp. BC1403]|uniref:hypothetical protein n=1 Tax=Pseudanabaena sp. BC1403 TaxID=2043171 RepID=UPI0011AFCD75